MDRELQKKIIEALLFLVEEPVKAEKVAGLLEVPSEEVSGLVKELQQDLAETGRGLQVFNVSGGYQMGTLPELAPYLEKAFGEEGPGVLSQAALETLAIVAYKQPVTRVDIESIRGVKCEHVLENLLKRKLIRITGRKDSPGRPLIYGTTPDFLKYFGLNDLEEMPLLEEGEE